MSTTKISCTEPGCDKTFEKGSDLSRHMWFHIPTDFRPLCPGTVRGANGGTKPCTYRYKGRRDLWKSHWANHHKARGFPLHHRFETLRMCHVKYVNSLPVPAPVSIATHPINGSTAGIPAINSISTDFQASLLNAPVSVASSQTLVPLAGNFGPTVAGMLTHFHPSISFSYPAFYNQPGPSMVAVPHGFPQSAPIVDHQGVSVPWVTGLENMQNSWQGTHNEFFDTHSAPIVDHQGVSVPWVTGLDDMQNSGQETHNEFFDTHSQQLYF